MIRACVAFSGRARHGWVPRARSLRRMEPCAPTLCPHGPPPLTLSLGRGCGSSSPPASRVRGRIDRKARASVGERPWCLHEYSRPLLACHMTRPPPRLALARVASPRGWLQRVGIRRPPWAVCESTSPAGG